MASNDGVKCSSCSTELKPANSFIMNTDTHQPADFETAISATGYGKFNVILLLCSLPAFWSAVSVTGSVSFIFTRAKCDMNLSLLDMGTANAIIYGGMITSAMVWGFLSDTLGRKQILVWGFIATGIVEIMAGLSQTFTMLLVTRFFTGLIFNGPFAVLVTYIAELHKTELRARLILLTSLFYTLASTTLPLVAWAILSNDSEVFLFGDTVAIRSWNHFLLVMAGVPLLSGLTCFFLPESPKFLMSRGRNEEALKVFQRIFVMNSGKSVDEFPIKYLIQEKPDKMKQGFGALKGGFRQIAPLFKRPYGLWLILMCCIQSGCMLGSNTLRLWFPHLAAMLGASPEAGLCSAIAPTNSTPLVAEATELCQPIEVNLVTYAQSMVAGAGTVVSYTVGGIVVNKCGKRVVAASCAFISAILSLLLPILGHGPVSVVAMITGALAFTSLCAAATSTIVVDLFPTSLRVMALATFFMCGRLGTLAGTVAFPALMHFGCYTPFVTIAVILIAIGLGCFVVPNTTLKKME